MRPLIHNGDCFELFRKLDDSSVDLICADLPYGTTNCKWDTCIPLEPLWTELNRIAKDNAAIILFAQTPFDKVLGASNLEHLRYEWIWEKTAATGFLNAKKMPLKAHENVLVFYKSLPKYFPQKTSGHKRKSAGRKALNSEVYGKAIKKTHYDSTDRYPRSVQVFPKDKQRKPLHPTQKPLALLEYIVSTYSEPGDIVLDFCMGSGTAGVASVKLGRKFIGAEKEEKYFDIASQRILSATALSIDVEDNKHKSQVSGAYITHGIRVSETEKRIISAIEDAKRAGTRVSKSNISKTVNISREHISRRYQYLFEDCA